MEVSIPGFLASGIASGIKPNNTRDLGLLYSEQPAATAGVFTTNKMIAAPVLLTKEKIGGRSAQAIIVNSGNANACTGAEGLDHARSVCCAVADELDLPEQLVLTSSTGIIGVPLPVEKINLNIKSLVSTLSPQGIHNFAEAIMTTDTIPKVALSKELVDKKEITICGVAKGSGMVMPRMATLLSFVVTDLALDAQLLDGLLRDVVTHSFNRITIDGETSTNDMVIMMANGQAGNAPLHPQSPDFTKFKRALAHLFDDLSALILKDAEGSTKVITVRVEGAVSDQEAQDIAYKVANSSLVKTAFYGEDVNWGRIMAAVGNAEATVFPENTDLFFDNLKVVHNGISTGRESLAQEIVKKSRFQVSINCHSGPGTAEVLTTDLTTDYVKINASYPT